MKVAVRRISLAPLSKFGCILGMVAALLPSLLCGLLGLGLASLLKRWLENWQEMTISVLGNEIARLDLVQLLGLDRLLGLLQTLGTASLPVLFLTVLALALVSGFLLAVMVTLVGLVYNLLAAATGGLVVEIATTGEPQDAE